MPTLWGTSRWFHGKEREPYLVREVGARSAFERVVKRVRVGAIGGVWTLLVDALVEGPSSLVARGRQMKRHRSSLWLHDGHSQHDTLV